MIGVMYCNFEHHTLIVVPPILINQWATEIERVSKHKPLIYYGAAIKKNISDQQLSSAPIVITTYNTLICDKEGHLDNVKWDRIIYDEAHHVRNPKTKKFESAYKVKAPIKWMVTGTPIQNKRADLSSLCAILGFTGSVDLNEIKTQFLLRRTKQDVGINLPKICTTTINVKWESSEQTIAEEMHSMITGQTYVSSRKSADYAMTVDDEARLLIAFLRSRQLCIGIELVAEHLNSLCDNGSLPEKYRVNNPKQSSKMNSFMETIQERRDNNQGKIIFCHYRAEIDMIAKSLKQAGFVDIYTNDGRNTKEQFANAISNAKVIILQIQTGCEGINLQENFSEIYFISPHWNPAVEDQAIARCHRIGQTKPVSIFKFIMGTFGVSEIKNKDNILFNTNSMEAYANSIQTEKRSIIDKFLN